VNLLYNAVQAMPDGGDIKLSACAGNNLKIEVSDSGPGIENKVRERIFTPFFTTKEGGTGLGLATVKKIVDAHRGKIDVISEPGEGTCFKLVFPR
jgi:signal transduction histidine kinase